MAAPSTETAIWLALRGRVESLVLTPAYPVAWPNETFAPVAQYIEVQHLPNSSDRIMIRSGGKRRYQGILQISVMAPLNQNAAVSTELAGLIASHFAEDMVLRYGAVAVRVTKRPDTAQGMRDDKASRWMTPVTIFYECFA